jgi:hypothetical protein
MYLLKEDANLNCKIISAVQLWEEKWKQLTLIQQQKIIKYDSWNIYEGSKVLISKEYSTNINPVKNKRPKASVNMIKRMF